jgi:hypothetical protein
MLFVNSVYDKIASHSCWGLDISFGVTVLDVDLTILLRK